MYYGLPDLEKISADFIDRLSKEGIAYNKNYPFMLRVFPQTWGSTSLGFGGIGGSAITTAYTTVLVTDDNVVGVYFNSMFAYLLKDVNYNFFEDMRNENMSAVYETSRYRRD